MQKIKIVSDKKLICYSKSFFLFGKGPRLYVSTELGGEEDYIATLPISTTRKFLGGVRILARTLRLEIRCGIFVEESTAIVSYHGAIYKVDCKKGTVELEHMFKPGMNNPLAFAEIRGVEGFTDGIYYGEYYLNNDRDTVSVYRRNNTGTWTSVYTFNSGSIYHIHTLVPDPEIGTVYILTGDEDSESAIYECRNDFAEVKPVVIGKQAYRSCVALPGAKGMVYTTDTPLEDNYLYNLDFVTKEIKEIIPISGPAIYGKIISNNEMLFSTSVEADSHIKGIRYQFTRKLGEGVKDRYTHLYYVKIEEDSIIAKEIFKARKDVFPMGACQFGTMMFPAGDGKLLFTCQSVRKYDNKTLMIEAL